jgi:hypothetical protein
MSRARLSLALLAVATLAVAESLTDAVTTFQQLRKDLIQAKGQQDWNASVAAAQRLKSFLNGSPDSTLEVALAQLRAGNSAQALIEAQQFVAMGQTHELLNSATFESLRTSLDPQIQRNQSEVAAARTAFALADPGLLPEDIDYDSATKQFFVTSILEQKVVVLDPHGAQRDFAGSPDHWPMMALKVDSRRRRLWVTEVALEAFQSVPASDQGRSVLLEYDLDHGTLLARYEGPAKGSLGDMALASNGEPIVSDGDGGGIYRLHEGGLQRIDHGDFISPQTIAVCPDGTGVYVPDYVRGLAKLDVATGAVTWIATGGQFALDGIDGLYCRDLTLIAIQNGATPERVIAFKLDKAGSKIVRQRLIERKTRTLGDPTHGVFVGEDFYYISNSGWDSLDEHGVVKPSSKPTPASIMRVSFASISAPGSG